MNRGSLPAVAVFYGPDYGDSSYIREKESSSRQGRGKAVLQYVPISTIDTLCTMSTI